LVTPAELTALQQVLSTGHQTLLLGRDGTAIGGTVSFNAIAGSQASGFVLPHGVTGLADFSRVSNLGLNGNFANYGNLYAFSTATNSTIGTLQAGNIFNGSGALLSSITPKSVVPNAVPKFDLNLVALGSIVNAGTISSSGSLRLTAGAGVIDNRGGTISAADGINVNAAKDAAYGSTISVLGGNWYSPTLNINAPTSAVNARVGEVSGVVNASAKDLHFAASTPELKFGELKLTGDPTFYNDQGSINMSNFAPTPDQSLAVVASQDVIIRGGKISTDTVTGTNAGNILIVAGANFTSVPTGGASGPVTIGTTGSATGGAIRITGTGPITSHGSGQDGDISLVAFDGSGANSSLTPGTIDIPGAVSLGKISLVPGSGLVTQANNAMLIVGGDITAPIGQAAATAPVTINADGTVASGSGTFTASGSGGQAGTVTIVTLPPGSVAPNTPPPSQITLIAGNTSGGTGGSGGNGGVIFGTGGSGGAGGTGGSGGITFGSGGAGGTGGSGGITFGSGGAGGSGGIYSSSSSSSSNFDTSSTSTGSITVSGGSIIVTAGGSLTLGNTANGPNGITDPVRTVAPVSIATETDHPTVTSSSPQVNLSQPTTFASDPTILSTDQTGVNRKFGRGSYLYAPTFKITDTTTGGGAIRETVQVFIGANASEGAVKPGWSLVSPATDITMTTPFGILHIPTDSAVLVHATDDGVSIYAMCPGRRDDVSFVVGDKNITLGFGNELRLSKAATDGGTSPIAVRDEHNVNLGNGIAAKFGEFSIPNALTKGGMYHHLAHGDAASKALLTRVMKAAVSVQTVTYNRGGYTH
jgi:adhesin HecA-like repeat protein